MAKTALSLKLYFTIERMEDLKRMAVFASVVQHGSMSGAARALGMSTSAVSQQVRKLESDGGVTLLHRSTRKLALTEAGQRYHARCAAMCAAADQARAELAASRDAPSGELRLSATVGFARHIAPALGELLAAHPALRLRLLVDDSPIDLINARIDLAVRYGRLQDSTWAARRLGGMQWYLCAAPGWVADHGVPQHPDALLSYSWLGFARENGGLLIDLRSPTGDPRALRVEPRIASNNQLSIQQMCEAGLGLALVGSMDSHDALQAGRLVRLLPDWSFGTLDIWAVTPQRDAQPAKVRQTIAALHRYLSQLPGVTELEEISPWVTAFGAFLRRDIAATFYPSFFYRSEPQIPSLCRQRRLPTVAPQGPASGPFNPRLESAHDDQPHHKLPHRPRTGRF